jgi:hypothetical protein
MARGWHGNCKGGPESKQPTESAWEVTRVSGLGIRSSRGRLAGVS